MQVEDITAFFNRFCGGILVYFCLPGIHKADGFTEQCMMLYQYTVSCRVATDFFPSNLLDFQFSCTCPVVFLHFLVFRLFYS